MSALGKRQVVECGLQALTKRRDAVGQRGHMHVLLGLGVELPQVLGQTMVALGPLLASPLELLALDHLREVQIEQPSLLAFELRQHVPQRLTARLQGLGQPFPHLCPGQFIGDESRLPQDTAEVRPHELVPRLGGGVARRAARTEGEPERIGTASTEGIMRAGGQRATATREPALATADAAAQ